MTPFQTMRKDGTFPITFWNYCNMDQPGGTAAAVADWVDAGMTVAMTPRYDPAKRKEFLAILDACGEAGLKAIVWDGRGQYWSGAWKKGGARRFRSEFRAAVKDLGWHPAVFGFHGGDEPHKGLTDQAFKTSKIHREEAPHLSCFMNLGPAGDGSAEWVGYDNYENYLDDYCTQGDPEFLCFDVYWQMLPEEHGTHDYFGCMTTFREAARRHKLPMWSTLCSVGHYRYRCPTEDDFRWQFNTAVANGCSGMAWFFLYMRDLHDNYRVPPIDEHWQRTETFEWLARVNKTFGKQHGEAAANLTLTGTYHCGKHYRTIEPMGGTPLVKWADSKHVPLIVSEFKDRKGVDHVALVNNARDDSTEAMICFRGRPDIKRIAWGGGETGVKVKGSPKRTDADYCEDAKVEAWLAPGQMELYRLATPKAKVTAKKKAKKTATKTSKK